MLEVVQEYDDYVVYEMVVDSNGSKAKVYIDMFSRSRRSCLVSINLDSPYGLGVSILGTTSDCAIKPFIGFHLDDDQIIVNDLDKFNNVLAHIQIATTKLIYATQRVLIWLRENMKEFNWPTD